jgi:hypothetical protein
MEWMPARLDDTGRKMRALQVWWWRWLEHMEWMPTRLDDTGRTMRALPIWMVKQAANLLLKGEARRIAANIAKLPGLIKACAAKCQPDAHHDCADQNTKYCKVCNAHGVPPDGYNTTNGLMR